MALKLELAAGGMQAFGWSQPEVVLGIFHIAFPV